VPSRLGRRGGALPVPGLGGTAARFFRVEASVDAGIAGRAEVFEDFELLELLAGEASLSDGEDLNFCDDFRGGGLGGKGDSLFFFLLLSFAFRSAISFPFTVEFDEEDVNDSRSDGRPCASSTTTSLSSGALPMRLRVTGGRVFIGLGWRKRGVILNGATTLGD